MTGNSLVKFFLQTPLHVLMGNTMLITVTGRKTGRRYTTPVNFYRENGTLWVLTSRDRTWWRNACGAQVSLRLHGRDLPAYAESIRDERVVALHLDDYLRHATLAARPLGVRMEKGAPDMEDVSRLAREKLFVKVKPAPQT
jgi:hypothetical protein